MRARAEKGKKRYNNGMKIPLKEKPRKINRMKFLNVCQQMRKSVWVRNCGNVKISHNKINYANNRSGTSVGGSS